MIKINCWKQSVTNLGVLDNVMKLKFQFSKLLFNIKKLLKIKIKYIIRNFANYQKREFFRRLVSIQTQNMYFLGQSMRQITKSIMLFFLYIMSLLFSWRKKNRICGRSCHCIIIWWGLPSPKPVLCNCVYLHDLFFFLYL